MHSNRINIIQRRAKRRILAMAIAATAFVGYNAFTLFGDDRPVKPPVGKMSEVPGVKAVGIRMINPNGKLPKARTETKSATENTGSLLPLPSSPMHPQALSIQSSMEEATLPPSPLTLPASSLPTITVAPSDAKSASGFSNLAAPPRMSDAKVKNPTGKLVMNFNKNALGKENSPIQSTLETGARVSNPIVAGPDLVDIRVVQPHLMSQPAKMPAFVLEKSAKKSQETAEPSALPSAQNAVRISVVDGVNEQIPLASADSYNEKQSRSRTPQLVKSKPTQLAHTVSLAQSTNLESQSTTDSSDEYVPPVEIDSATGQQFFSIGHAGPSSKPPKNSAIKASLSDTFESQSTSGTSEPPFFYTHTNSFSSGLSTDSLHRRFDSRASKQSSIAAVELECLGATTIDLSGKLVAVAVQDESVCKALHNERTVSLVGNQAGTTLVQIWTADLGNKPQVIRVNVSQPWGKAQARRSDVNNIKEVIAQGFPRSDVNILSKDDGTFEVRGTTDSEESARRILELVRKLYLVPIKDKLTVSY